MNIVDHGHGHERCDTIDIVPFWHRDCGGKVDFFPSTRTFVCSTIGCSGSWPYTYLEKLSKRGTEEINARFFRKVRSPDDLHWLVTENSGKDEVTKLIRTGDFDPKKHTRLIIPGLS